MADNSDSSKQQNCSGAHSNTRAQQQEHALSFCKSVSTIKSASSVLCKMNITQSSLRRAVVLCPYLSVRVCASQRSYFFPNEFIIKVSLRKCDDSTNFERCFHYYFLLFVLWVRSTSIALFYPRCAAPVISERINARSQRWAEKVNVILSNLIRTEMEEALSHAISVVKYSSHPSCSHQNVPFPVADSPSITSVSLASPSVYDGDAQHAASKNRNRCNAFINCTRRKSDKVLSWMDEPLSRVYLPGTCCCIARCLLLAPRSSVSLVHGRVPQQLATRFGDEKFLILILRISGTAHFCTHKSMLSGARARTLLLFAPFFRSALHSSFTFTD